MSSIQKTLNALPLPRLRRCRLCINHKLKRRAYGPIILGTPFGLFRLNPHRVVVSGRLKHFISAFGEHVIAKEVEEALVDCAERGRKGAR
jgi:hypothetical protein